MKSCVFLEASSDNFLSKESSATSKTVTANTFVGEDPPELPLPAQPRSVSGSAGKQHSDLLNNPVNPTLLDPSVWLEVQREQSIRALGVAPDRGSSEPPLLTAGGPSQTQQRAVSEGPNMDLLNALIAAQRPRPGTPGSTSAFTDTSSAFPVAPKPRSKLQKLLPLLHVILVWSLFAFFAVWKEPAVHSENSPWQDKESSFWTRWARLSPQSSKTVGDTWQVQQVVRVSCSGVLLV